MTKERQVFDVYRVGPDGCEVYIGELSCYDGGEEYLASSRAAGAGKRILREKEPAK